MDNIADAVDELTKADKITFEKTEYGTHADLVAEKVSIDDTEFEVNSKNNNGELVRLLELTPGKIYCLKISDNVNMEWLEVTIEHAEKLGVRFITLGHGCELVEPPSDSLFNHVDSFLRKEGSDLVGQSVEKIVKSFVGYTQTMSKEPDKEEDNGSR